MRSTTVGWLTSMVRVLPVTAENMWLSQPRPEACESAIQPMETRSTAPSSNPMISDDRTFRMEPEDADSAPNFWERSWASDSWGIGQGYHCRERVNGHGEPFRPALLVASVV